MLLAEALNERADAQRRLIDLKNRIGENARVQEGEVPAEDPNTLLGQAVAATDRMLVLVVAVNITNATTRLPDGMTITEALAHRNALGQRIRLVSDAASSAAGKLARWGSSEIREIATLNVAALRTEADRLSVLRRDLDTQLQRLNWSTELAVDI